MSVTNWSLEDAKKYDQMAMDDIEKAICYKRNGKIFLLLVFKGPKSIEYVRDEMAFMLDSNVESLVAFTDQPTHIYREALLVETNAKEIPKIVAIYCIPSADNMQTEKEKILSVKEHILDTPDNASNIKAGW